MLSECFEMDCRDQPPRSRLQKKVLAEEYELRDLPQGTAVSCWWLTLPVFYYLTVIAGGVIASISVGDLTAAFADNCVFYANLTLKGLDHLNGSKTLTWDNVHINSWGDSDTCLFPEYTSVACVMYAGVLLVMVLQCGRGGGKSAFRGRGIAESWRIVPIAFVFNLLFLILSSIVFGNIQNGFSAFCDGMSQIGSSQSLGNVSSCAQVLQYNFPWDKFNTNLHTEYVLAKLGATLQLIGSLLAFLTIIIRCCLPADFIVYRRRQIMIVPDIQSSRSYEEDPANVASTSGTSHPPDPQQYYQHYGDDTEKTLTSATVECHNQFNDPKTSQDDTESIHSARSDANLVPEVKIVRESSKAKIIAKGDK